MTNAQIAVPANRPAVANQGAALSVDAIYEFSSEKNLLESWKGLTKSKVAALPAVAAEKFALLSTFRDTWSREMYAPRVFTADIQGTKTFWLTVDCDHGKQAYVFDAAGRPLASGFMPETGDDLTFTKGFVIDEYLEYDVIKNQRANT